MKCYNFMLRLLLQIACLVSVSVSLQAQTPTCNCKEYIYLNEPAIGAVLKFEVGASYTLTELVGANGGTPPNQHWYPGVDTSELPSPHGLATDLNGRLYIGSQVSPNNPIRQFDCDGNISPISPTTITNTSEFLFNMFSIGNTIYTTRNLGPAAWNSCTGALIGTLCLNGRDGLPLTDSNVRNWGLSYNKVTEMVYATKESGANRAIYAFSRAQLEQSIANGTCIDPLVVVGSVSPVANPIIRGVTSDNDGNIYVVAYQNGLASEVIILKYNSAGAFVAMSPTSISYRESYGIVWSETSNLLYVANRTDADSVDCISAFNPSTMQYVGTAVPNPGLSDNNSAKALTIIKECCPVNLPTSFQRNVCGGIGTKFYLNQEAFSDCDGIVCGSSWVPDGTLTNMTFDACDNSVVVTGTGCGTFTLNLGNVISTGCPAQSSTFTICNTVPTATAIVTSACEANTPGSIALINISNAINADQAGISLGAMYYGPSYGSTATIDIVAGSGTFTNLSHNTQYTVRVYDGSHSCYLDYTVTTPTSDCPSPCTVAVTSATPSACNPATNTYDLAVNVTYSSPPTGDITINVGGTNYTFTPDGNSPDTYMINNLTANDTTGIDVSATFVADAACTYTLVDAYNAPASCSCNLSATTSGTAVTCNGGSNGTARVTVSGNTGTVSYLWDFNNATTDSLTGLSAGTYTVTITESASCTFVTNYVVSQPIALSAICDVTNVTVSGGSDGTAIVVASAGTSPYTYLWSSGGMTDTLMNKAAGTYTVIVTDANGCTATCSSDIQSLSSPCQLTITQDSTGVCNDNGTPTDGSDDYYQLTLNATATNGAAQYTVLVDGVVRATTNYGTSTTVSISADSMNHSVQVRDVTDVACDTILMTPRVAPCVDNAGGSGGGACSITITQSTQNSCNNNSTLTNTTDDYYTLTVNATGSNAGSLYEVVLNAAADGTGGTVLNVGGTPYGTAVTVGTTAGTFAANGSTVYTLTVRDSATPTCRATFTTNIVVTCSAPCPTGNCGRVTVTKQ